MDEPHPKRRRLHFKPHILMIRMDTIRRQYMAFSRNAGDAKTLQHVIETTIQDMDENMAEFGQHAQEIKERLESLLALVNEDHRHDDDLVMGEHMIVQIMRMCDQASPEPLLNG